MRASSEQAPVTAERLIAAAQAHAAALRARAQEAEGLRRVPDESIALLCRDGFFRVYQPRRFGGSEIPMQSVLQAISALAEGCASTAWVTAVLQIHAFLLGLFPRAAQDDVFGTDAQALIAGVLQPRGTLVAAPGGYRLSGGPWPFASGCDHAQWAILGAMIEGSGAEPAMVLVPMREVEIRDDWFVSGLKATGSKSLMVASATIPAHRVLGFGHAFGGGHPESGAGEAPLFRSAAIPMLALNVTGPALGAARATLDDFLRHIANRRMAFSGEPQTQAPETHRQVAEAKIKIDIAGMLLDRAAGAMRDAAEAGTPMALEPRARVRLEAAYAVRQCVEAVETLFLASGGGVLQETHPIQRAQRDVHAMNVHAVLPLDTNLALYGSIALGLKPNTLFV